MISVSNYVLVDFAQLSTNEIKRVTISPFVRIDGLQSWNCVCRHQCVGNAVGNVGISQSLCKVNLMNAHARKSTRMQVYIA